MITMISFFEFNLSPRIFLIGFIFSVNILFSQEDDKTLKFFEDREYTQEYVDSITDLNWRSFDPEILRQILETDKKLLGWESYYWRKASRSLTNRQWNEAIMYADKTMEAHEESSDKHWFLVDVITSLIIKGKALRSLKLYTQSIQVFYQALEKVEEYKIVKGKDYRWRSFIVTGIAGNYLKIGNDSLALEKYLKAEKDSLYMSLHREAIMVYNRIGLLYTYLEDFKKAKKYFKKGIKKSLTREDGYTLGGLYGNLGNIYKYESKIDSCALSYSKALSAHKALETIDRYKYSKYYTSYYEGYLLIHDKQILEGASILEKLASDVLLLESIDKDLRDLLREIYKDLIMVYAQINAPNKMKAVLQKQQFVFEKLNQKYFNTNIDNLEVFYQTKEKEASITQLEASQSQQTQIIKQQRIIGFSLVGLLLAFAGFGYLFWRQRKLKDQYEKENLEQRLLRSQMNPHFIGNAMNVVSSLVSRNSDEAIPFINKLSNLFRLVLINSREEFVSLGEELETIKGYLDLQVKFIDKLKSQITIEEAIDQETIIIPPMLIQPLVENAIKHGLMPTEDQKKVEVKISLDKDSKLLLVEVCDNGIGMRTKPSNHLKKTNSISGDVIKERLQILKKRFKVNARINYINLDQGTKVELYLPYLLDE